MANGTVHGTSWAIHDHEYRGFLRHASLFASPWSGEGGIAFSV
jgi:hypothetical protein